MGDLCHKDNLYKFYGLINIEVQKDVNDLSELSTNYEG